MDRKITIGLLLLVIVFGIVYILTSYLENPINTASVIDNPDEQNNGVQENVVEITSEGFTPETLTIQRGETVTWINKDTEEHWPATDIHPTHTVYPGSDIKKCFEDGADRSKIFDSCRGLKQGEEYSFTFTEAGTWEYHDHKSSRFDGTVVVE